MDGTADKIVLFVGVVIGLGIISLVMGSVMTTTVESAETAGATTFSFTSNPTNVVNSGYLDFADATGGFGTGATQTQRHFITTDNLGKIRQSGVSTQFQIKLNTEYNDTDFTSFYVSVWRHNATETGWNQIDTTGDILSKIQATAGGVQTISLDPSEYLTHQEGDFVGFGWTNNVDASNPQMLSIRLESGNSTYFYNDNPIPTLVDLDWTSADSVSTNWAPIKLMAQAPSIVFIGDSITGGEPDHHAYVDSDESGDSHEDAVAYKVGQSLGVSIQNMGHGSPINQSADGLARFTEDVVELNPRVVVIGYGTADINNSTPLATFSSNMQSMITEAQNAGITPVLMEVYPRDYDTDTKDNNRLLFNAEIRRLATVNGITYVSNENIGTGGTPNALAPANDSGDGIHLNDDGHTAVANNVVMVLNSLGIPSSWADAANNVNQTSQSAFGLILVIIIIIAAVVILSVIKQF